ncbi:MAG TPA: hypothetical protein PK785_08725, partial [Bacteroidales bacterium]|nr:hypothetical protein [Bacteroidales bacterium]
AFRATSGTIMIGQVDIDGYKRSPQSKRIIERAGEPDMIIDGKKLQDNEEEWSFGLYSLLSYNSNFTIDIRQDTSNFKVKVSGSDTTLVLVDGVYDRLNQDLIPTLPVSEVSSIDIIKCADNFLVILMETTGEMLIKPIFCGSIININTIRGKGILDAWNIPKGINKFKIPVFATPKEYYSPNFETLKPEDSRKPDLRSVLHWQPLLVTNNVGTATTSFYNADNVGDMVIVVEAFSQTGKIGYAEMGYKVGGKQDKPIFTGHFPNEPVFPGVMQIEAMAQCGGLFVLNQMDPTKSYSTYFMKIDGIKFRKKIVPGDTMVIKVDLVSPMRRGIASMKGYIFVGGQLASEGEFMAQIVENK